MAVINDLKARLKKGPIIRSIGCHDAFTALIAERAGFEVLFVGGFGATASLLGLPDLGIITLNEMAGVVRRICARVSVPVIADGDTGFGGVHNVQRTVEEFEAAGAAGVILEDQVSPKRCGHFDGKNVIPVADMVVKLTAALKARKNPRFLVVARTDARDVTGIADAIRRANRYHEAGADMVFIESPGSVQELKLIPKKVKAPLLANMLTGGKTPNIPVAELDELGYAMVVYPIESLLATATAMKRLSQSILRDGSVDRVRNDMIPFGDVKELLGIRRPAHGRRR